MRLLSRRRSLATNLIVTSLAAIATLSVVFTTVAAGEIKAELTRQADDRLEFNLLYAWQLIGGHDGGGVGFRLDDGNLYSGSSLQNGNQEIIDSILMMTGGIASIFLGDVSIATGFTRADGAPAIGVRLDAGSPIADALRQGTPYRGTTIVDGTTYLTAADPILTNDGNVVGAVAVSYPWRTVHSAEREIIHTLAVTGAVAALATGIGLLLLTRRLLRPVGGLTDVMNRLAGDDTELTIPGLGRRDELGQMAAAVQVFQQHARARQQLDAERVERDEQARRDKEQALGRVATTFEAKVGHVVDDLDDQAKHLQACSVTMQSVVEDTRRRAATVVDASDGASTNVEAIARRAEDLTAAITEIARHLDSATTIAAAAANEADESRARVAELMSSAEKIQAVLTLIRAVAGKTNLLALNASIEAARAGDAGNGFAVVAGEVKALANQTAHATEEIGEQIRAVQATTQRAASAIGRIAGTIGNMEASTSAIALAVERQDVATRAIAGSIEAAVLATREVSQHIAKVAEAALATDSAAGKVADASTSVGERSASLRSEVADFLTRVKAA